jgi:hypothetical protein
MTELGNLVEEYQSKDNLSLEKISRLQMLLVTYYMQTGNIIHRDVFEKIKQTFEKLSDGDSFVKKNIEFLFQFGCLERNPKFVLMEKEK